MTAEIVQTGIIPGVDAGPVDTFFATITNEGLWKRAGVIWLGGVLVIIGVVLLIAGTRAVKTAASLATKVASKGVL